MEELTDSQLVSSARAGNLDCFSQLIDRYYNRAFTRALGYVKNWHVAEDIIQEVFLKAYNSIKQIESPNRFEAWLNRTVKNCCIDWMRRERSQRNRIKQAAQTREVSDPEEEKYMEVIRITKSLPDEIRRVITYKYMDGMTCPEIAKIMNLPEGTVRSILARAYQKIRKLLGDD